MHLRRAVFEYGEERRHVKNLFEPTHPFVMFTLSTETIAVPTRDGHVDDHFGHCGYYSLFTVVAGRIMHREILPSPEGCGCKSNIASVLQAKGVGVMLAGSMGEGAKQVLTKHHIRVIRGCSGAVESLVAAYLHGEITDSGDACSAHECGEHH